MDLFEAGMRASIEKDQPLAARLRPRRLEEFIGQEHILGQGRLLRRAIQADQLSSLIFYGPPGTGKTTLAVVIANTTASHFISLNAVLAGVADIRRAIDEAQERRKLHQQRTILFVDEVHRFNKAQQDALLPWVENGVVMLIGATTENPYFSVNRPLLSRSRVFQLKALDEQGLRRIAQQALADPRGYAHREVHLAEAALDHLINVANGDARTLLNALELAVETTQPDAQGRILIGLEVAEESIQRRALLYDKEGDYHFDTISAFIKSLRGSDPDAPMYWMARMLYAGEDPHFIFRRMLIFASEDVGLADPQALAVVVAAAESFDRVGLPEGRFPLAQAALYLATAPKSNSVFAFFDALAAVEKEQEDEVPSHLRDASRDSEGFGHGANYLYPHAYRDHWVAQQYLPASLQGRLFYQPSDQGYEAQLGGQVQRRREVQLAAMMEGRGAPPEVLTFSPPDKEREQWLQRVAGEASAHLARLRQQLFAALALQRHHLVLELNARSGLFTWEALRLAPEGGVWALCPDKASAVMLQERSAHLPELDRPVVLHGPLVQLRELVEERSAGQRFDALVGHHALAGMPEKAQAISQLRAVLRPGGCFALAENLPRRAQRLHALAGLAGLPAELRQRVIQAEEAIYADPANPLVNWGKEELEALFRTAGFIQVEAREEITTTSRRLSPQQLAQWFNPGGETHHTYAHYLGRLLEEEELHLVRRAFERELANRMVEWTSTQLLVTGRVDLSPGSS
ncbi:MAG: AAA family ATPase [Candidatus Latescibacteria bacterium]|nr:AAA family ATPase [Candidatus Latescibacterota bacterium]